MVNYLPDTIPSATLDAVFGALSDPTRRSILARLSQGSASVKELAAPFDISLPAVSRHLKVLERAGLLERRIDGRIHRCDLRPEPLAAAESWIEFHRRFWEERFDALARYLQDTANPPAPSSSPASDEEVTDTEEENRP